MAVIYQHYLNEYLTPFFFLERARLGPFLVTHLSLLTNGWFGVNLFFILSGFVLALPYEQQIRALESRADTLAFYARRARRLLPLYYFVLLVTMFAAMSAKLWSLDFLREVALMTSFGFVFDGKMFLPRYNIVLWSLANEFWFAVAFPLLWLVRRRVGIGPVLVVGLIGAFAMRLYGAASWEGSQMAELLMRKDGPAGRIDDFLVGMAVCQLFVRKKLPSGALALVCVVLGLGFVMLGANLWDNVRLDHLPYEACALVNNILQVGFVLVLLGALGDGPRLLRKLFAAWPLQLLGAMCYSLYIWHMAGPVQRRAPWWDVWDVPVYIVLLLLLAALTYRFIEFPKKTWGDLFSGFPR